MSGPLPLPEWRGRADDAARVIRVIDEWVASPAIGRLLRESGADVPTGSAETVLEQVCSLSRRWDRRAGRERDQAAQTGVDARLDHAVFDSGEMIGTAERTVPARRRYDAIVMTAGMVRAQLVKPRFVQELLSGGLETAEIAFLGGFRAFSESESELAATLGFDAADEVESMIEGMERQFGPLGAPLATGEGTAGPTGWREFRWTRGPVRLRVLAAPSSDPRRRANTADTFRFWAERCGASASSVLTVTTPIYVPYQSTVAVEVLGAGHGFEVETIGATASALDLGELSQPFLAQHHLQEIRSALLAMRSLRAVLIDRSS